MDGTTRVDKLAVRSNASQRIRSIVGFTGQGDLGQHESRASQGDPKVCLNPPALPWRRLDYPR